MWESFKKSVIEVHDPHIPLMRIGARKWKSEYPASMGIMQLTKVNKKDIENGFHTSSHQEVPSFQFYTTGRGTK